jgi:hypothetical protein
LVRMKPAEAPTVVTLNVSMAPSFLYNDHYIAIVYQRDKD